MKNETSIKQVEEITKGYPLAHWVRHTDGTKRFCVTLKSLRTYLAEIGSPITGKDLK